MQITFLGATREVTGSCTLVEAAGKRFLVDCGMEQGKNIFENLPCPIPESELDFALLTHAHIDHSGLLPLLYKRGFRGNIYATNATRNLSEIMLQDSAHIQEAEAEYRTRKNLRAGKPPVEPLYDSDDAAGAVSLFRGFPYDKRFAISEGIEARFTDAGHLLGSASIELWLTENGETKKLVFSGDIGNIDQPLLRDPQFIREADYVVIESTYGNREHAIPPDTALALAEVIQKTLDRGGNVVIPSFAVGRTQEMLYFIRKIKEEGLVTGHDGFPVYVDSPLAVSATRVFTDNADSCFDPAARALLDRGIDPISFPDLHTAVSSEESVAINSDTVPKVILSASGMCDAGRIRHHLKHNLWRPESTVLFVGYQSSGTLGRMLADGAKEVSLFGEKISVQAEVLILAGVSGHGDSKELMKWAAAFDPKPKRFFVNHGENTVAVGFAERLEAELGVPSLAPASGTEFDLANDCLIRLTDPIPVKKPHGEAIDDAKSSVEKRLAETESAYRKLEKAFARLSAVVECFKNESDQSINALRNAIYGILDKFETRESKNAARSSDSPARKKNDKKKRRH
ncbi:MAG: MBL fold metallo-hydrolase [Clostridia bacterium]|nr:MBL fold metallo-hydrolase [Clostridia bacterium]